MAACGQPCHVYLVLGGGVVSLLSIFQVVVFCHVGLCAKGLEPVEMPLILPPTQADVIYSHLRRLESQDLDAVGVRIEEPVTETLGRPHCLVSCPCGDEAPDGKVHAVPLLGVQVLIADDSMLVQIRPSARHVEPGGELPIEGVLHQFRYLSFALVALQGRLCLGLEPLRDIPLEERAGRLVSSDVLIDKLGIRRFVKKTAAREDFDFNPKTVYIPLSQHVGKPATPTVKEGDKVKVSDLIAVTDATALGIKIHASISGTVKKVTDKYVVIER